MLQLPYLLSSSPSFLLLRSNWTKTKPKNHAPTGAVQKFAASKGKRTPEGLNLQEFTDSLNFDIIDALCELGRSPGFFTATLPTSSSNSLNHLFGDSDNDTPFSPAMQQFVADQITNPGTNMQSIIFHDIPNYWPKSDAIPFPAVLRQPSNSRTRRPPPPPFLNNDLDPHFHVFAFVKAKVWGRWVVYLVHWTGYNEMTYQYAINLMFDMCPVSFGRLRQQYEEAHPEEAKEVYAEAFRLQEAATQVASTPFARGIFDLCPATKDHLPDERFCDVTPCLTCDCCLRPAIRKQRCSVMRKRLEKMGVKYVKIGNQEDLVYI